jgi:hypothetical protein
MQNKQAIAIAIGYIYKFITVLYCSKKFYKFKQVSNNLLYNDFIVNKYIQLDWEQVFTTCYSLSIQIQ